jgi:hypothetical protein
VGEHAEPCIAHEPPSPPPPQLGHAVVQGPHVPLLVHVSGIVPLHCCEPGEHTPEHTPFTHACPEQSVGGPHAPP